MTQRQLAAGTLSVSFISMVEHDRVRPSLATLRLLCERLGEPLAHFLQDAPTAAEQAELARRRGEGWLRQHRFTEAMEAFSAAAAPAQASGDRTLLIRSELGMGQALAGIRQFELAEAHLSRARELAQGEGDPDLAGAAAHALGFLLFRARRFPQAREVLDQALAQLRAAGRESEITGKVLALLGRVYVELGLPAQAREYYRHAAAILQRAGDPAHQALLAFNLGVAYEREGSLALARSHLQRAAELFAVQENRRLLGVALRSLGILHLSEGDAAAALAPLSRSLELAGESADDEGVAQSLVELARARLMAGETAAARETAERARDLAARIDDPAEAARAEAVLAAAAAAGGAPAEAIARLEGAIATFQRLDMRDDLARACRDLGFLLMDRGDLAGAAHRFAQALRLQPPAPGRIAG